ncbi:hypothetical protein ACNERO_004957, partial [Escherichia coli]
AFLNLVPYEFPVPAGINRRKRYYFYPSVRVPRASGDKPPYNPLSLSQVFILAVLVISNIST